MAGSADRICRDGDKMARDRRKIPSSLVILNFLFLLMAGRYFVKFCYLKTKEKKRDPFVGLFLRVGGGGGGYTTFHQKTVSCPLGNLFH